MITVLAGGVGAARFLQGLMQVVDASTVTAIVNVGDDFVLHGLHISPDIDTVRYTLAGDIGEQGWGRAEDTTVVMNELARLARVAPQGSEATDWFHLGDRDLATHLYRTQRLQEGATLSTVTAELDRAAGVRCRLLPVTDDPLRTMVELATGEVVTFQQYFVGLRHEVPVASLSFDGVERAEPAPGVIAAIHDADKIIIAPSNPFVSIAPVLAVAGVRDAVVRRRDHVVAISPIVGGQAIKGPAARMLTELGHARSAVGVATLWTPFASTMLIDQIDEQCQPQIEAEGMRCVTTSTIMTNARAAASLASAAVQA